MNILYYDNKIPLDEIYDIWRSIKTKLPEEELLALPRSTQLLINIPAEDLFNISDKIWVALDEIKEERPEEYEKAYNNRMVILRDKQWKEAMDQAYNKTKNKKPVIVCDNCTAKNSCCDEECGKKTRCVWHSTNPGGI